MTLTLYSLIYNIHDQEKTRFFSLVDRKSIVWNGTEPRSQLYIAASNNSSRNIIVKNDVMWISFYLTRYVMCLDQGSFNFRDKRGIHLSVVHLSRYKRSFELHYVLCRLSLFPPFFYFSLHHLYLNSITNNI